VEKLIVILLGLNMKFKVNLKAGVRPHTTKVDKVAPYGGAVPIYGPQKEVGSQVISGIENGKVFQLIIAETQSGKTGTMVHIAQEYERIYCGSRGLGLGTGPSVVVVTGLSSVDWKVQTKSRFPPGFPVYHRNDLKKLSLNLENCLLLIDEVQIASKKDMSLDVLLQNCGAKDFDFLRENNVSIVMVSATPNKVYDDIKEWSPKDCQVVVQKNGYGYTGLKTLLESGRLLQADDLWVTGYSAIDYAEKNALIDARIDVSLENIRKLRDFIMERYDSALFHIVRTPYTDAGEEVRCRFESECDSEFEYFQCDHSTDHDILKIIQKKPSKHTFLFIKEQLRCAVTLHPKENVGVLYDRVSKMDNVMVQGLAGRATGYDVPDHVVVFSSVKSIERYIECVDNGFNKMNVSYSGKGDTFVCRDNFVEDDKTSVHSMVSSING